MFIRFPRSRPRLPRCYNARAAGWLAKCWVIEGNKRGRVKTRCGSLVFTDCHPLAPLPFLVPRPHSSPPFLFLVPRQSLGTRENCVTAPALEPDAFADCNSPG